MFNFFLYSSALALLMGCVLILVTTFFLFTLVRRVSPLLDEAETNVRELGDLANSTVTHVSETMELVETRVTAAMTQVNAGGKDVQKRGTAVASAVAGAFVAVRMGLAIRTLWQNAKNEKQAKKKWWFGNRKSNLKHQKGKNALPWWKTMLSSGK